MLTQEEKGRMLRRLQAHRKNTYYNYGNSRWVTGERFWTDEQIQEALKITKKEFNSLLEATKRRTWTEKEVNKALTDYVKKNGKWPTTHTLRAKGMPYAATVNRFFSNTWWGGSATREGLDRWVALYAEKHIKTISPELVFGIPNVTDRLRIMREVGIEKLIRKGEKIQQDDFGTLWKLPFAENDDPHALYVEVVNSSPRLDVDGNPIMSKGSYVYDHHFLRVPPDTETARAAVAWTFNKDVDQFVGFAAQS